MKKYCKVISILFVCMLGALAFYGCSRVDVTSKAEIVLNITSPVEDITVVSSAGKVTKSGNKVVIQLDNRRPVTISISSDGLKTITLNFTAKDFESSGTVTKDINFSEPLTSVIKLKFKNESEVKLVVDDPSVKVTNKSNNFTLVTANRDPQKQYTFTATAADAQAYNGVIKGDQIINGLYSKEIILAPAGKACVQIITEKWLENSIITNNFNFVTPILVGNNISMFIPKQIYYIMLDKTDSIALQDYEQKCTLIKGDKVDTYGTVVDLTRKQDNTDFTQKLYIDHRKTQLGGKLYSAREDGSFSEVYVAYEEIMTDNEYKQLFYIPLSTKGELHVLIEYDNRPKMIYTFDASDIAASKTKPLKVIYNDNVTVLDWSYTTRAFKVEYNNYNFDTNQKIEGDTQTYVSCGQQIVYNGENLEYKNLFKVGFRLECIVDFGEYSAEAQNYSIFCNGESFDNKNITDVDNNKKIVFNKMAFDKNNLLDIEFNRIVLVQPDPENWAMLGSQRIVLDSSDVTIADGVKKITNVIKLKNYTRLEPYRLESGFDFSEYTGFDCYQTNLYNVYLQLANIEQDDAQLVNHRDFMYVSNNAKFNIIYEFDVHNETQYGKITLTAARKKADGTAPQQDFTSQDMLEFYKNKPESPEQFKPYPFDIVGIKKNISNVNKY